jgi:excisionase family DNA binding protein
MNHRTTSPDLLKVRDVAAKLNMSEWAVRNLIHSGDLPAVNIAGDRYGARYRINPTDLQQFLEIRVTAA